MVMMLRHDSVALARNEVFLMFRVCVVQARGGIRFVENTLVAGEHEEIVDRCAGEASAERAEDGCPQPSNS